MSGRDAVPSGKAGVLFGDFSGGFTAALLALPGNMVCGLIAFGPLGPEYASLGIISAMFVSVFTGFSAGAFGCMKNMITAPQVSTAIIFSSVVDNLLRAKVFNAADPHELSIVIALSFGAVLLSGIIQILFSLFRVGRLIRYIPYPVIAGFFNGTAALILIGQIKPFVKFSQGFAWLSSSKLEILGRLGQWDAVQLEITLSVFVFCLLLDLLFKRLPAPLIALAVGSLGYYAVELFFFPNQFKSASQNPGSGQVLFSLDLAKALPGFVGDRGLKQFWPLIFNSALSIAVIGSINTLFAGVSYSATRQQRYKGNRDLFAQGIGNSIGALVGAIPGELSLSRTMINHRAGGRRFPSVCAYSLVVFLIVFFLSGYLSLIPKAVIAGIMLQTGLRLIDGWSMKFLAKLFTSKMKDKKELFFNILVMGMVIAVTLAKDLISAVFVGLALALLILVGQMKEDIVRRCYSGRKNHSKIARDEAALQILEDEGRNITVLELEGPLFFGSAVVLSEKMDIIIEQNPKFMIMDFQHVTRVDVSGVRMLETICRKLIGRGSRVYLSSINGIGSLDLYFNDLGIKQGLSKAGVRTFLDIEHALEAAEDAILKLEGKDQAEGLSVSLDEALRGLGLKPEQARSLAEYFTKIELKAGQVIFQEGSPGNSLLFLQRGLVEVLVGQGSPRRNLRVRTWGPGAFFGETALMDGGSRVFTARSLEPSTCYRLSRAQFGKIQEKSTSLAFQLLMSLGRISAESLRQAYEMGAKSE